MDGREWFDLVLDPGWESLFDDVVGGDPLGFPGYRQALEAAKAKTGEAESMLVARGSIDGQPILALSSVFGFLGGSMGAAHGERVCRAFELATQHRLPVVAMTASGGARMQEGMVALSQMPATLQARAAHRACGLKMVAVLRHPTTGGVFASYGNAADRLIAIEGATIGFAGPRVAEAFTGQPLPEGSHTADNALGHGLVHGVVASPELKATVAAALHEATPRPPAAVTPPPQPAAAAATSPPQPAAQASFHRARWRGAFGRVPKFPDEDAAWAAVQSARDASRTDRIRAAFPEPGPATIGGRRCIVVDSPKTPTVEDFREARARITQAEHDGLPLVALVDMVGADPSAASEASGIAREISRTMHAAVTAATPTVALVYGEGGSGGALALCAGADRLGICEGASFSVIAPEGAAAILRRDDLPAVARDLRCGPSALQALGLADQVVPDDEAFEWVSAALGEVC
ncbi:MAG: carboxyl transferase domain-containing protein [Actinomycetota bacterium]